MKRIKYKVSTEFNIGTEKEPQYKTFFADRFMFPVTKENIETVKAIAYNGEYTIEDDGQPEPVNPTLSDHEVLNALLGVTE